jgi:hypothetical protein
VVIRARFIGERLQFFSYLPTVEKKPTNIVDLFLVIYKQFEPFAVTILLMLVEFVVASSCCVAGHSV